MQTLSVSVASVHWQPLRLWEGPQAPSRANPCLQPPASSNHPNRAKHHAPCTPPCTQHRAPRTARHAACGAAAHPCICRVYCGRAFTHTGRPLSKYTDVIYIYVIYILLAMPNLSSILGGSASQVKLLCRVPARTESAHAPPALCRLAGWRHIAFPLPGACISRLLCAPLATSACAPISLLCPCFFEAKLLFFRSVRGA